MAPCRSGACGSRLPCGALPQLRLPSHFVFAVFVLYQQHAAGREHADRLWQAGRASRGRHLPPASCLLPPASSSACSAPITTTGMALSITSCTSATPTTLLHRH